VFAGYTVTKVVGVFVRFITPLHTAISWLDTMHGGHHLLLRYSSQSCGASSTCATQLGSERQSRQVKAIAA
jgi:hypothetical protein